MGMGVARRYLHSRQFDRPAVEALIPVLRDVLLRHGIRAGFVFGSAVHEGGDCQPCSVGPGDLDVAVLAPSGTDDWLRYHDVVHGDLCQAIGADNVDLVLLDRAPLSLQVRVVLDGVDVMAGHATDDLREDVLRRSADVAAWGAENWAATRAVARAGVGGAVNMVNRERVARFVQVIREAVIELRELDLGSMPRDDFVADRHTRALAEHFVRIAIEATLDLGRHVIVSTGLGLPQEYREIGRILAERGIVSMDLGRRLQAMAGMRNVLVHLYLAVDHEVIYRTVVADLGAFEEAVACIVAYVDGLPE